MSGRPVQILGVDCLLFEGQRPSTILPRPDFPVVYHARHSDFDMSYPSTLEQHVLVNFWGTVFAATPIPPNNDDLIVVDEIELADGTIWARWTEEDEMEHEAELLEFATEIQTEDGYIFHLQPDGTWSDGDITYKSLAEIQSEVEITVLMT